MPLDRIHRQHVPNDFQDNELLNVVLQHLISNPVVHKEGKIFYNSFKKIPFYSNGVEWIPFFGKPVQFHYSSEVLMLDDQPIHNNGYIYYRSDQDIYYEYLGTTLGAMDDYNPFGGLGLRRGAGAGLSIDADDKIQLGNAGAGYIDISDTLVFEEGVSIVYSNNGYFTKLALVEGEIKSQSDWDDGVNYYDTSIKVESSVSGNSLQFKKEKNGIYQLFDFNVSSDLIQITDQINSKGLEYFSDYEVNFTARSLITRQYLESAIGDIDLSVYVPYIGATSDVNLGLNNLLVNSITLNNIPTVLPTAQASLYFDQDEETLAVILNGVTQKVGEDNFFQVKNQSGATIPKGTAVRFDGAVGDSSRIKVVPFLADGTYSSIYFAGILDEDIPNGGNGKAFTLGKVRGLNTSMYPLGTILYCSPTVAGGFTTTPPIAPNNIISVAVVITVSATVGTLLVRPKIGSNINQDEGVKIVTPITGNILQLQASGLWENKSLSEAGIEPAFSKGSLIQGSGISLTGTLLSRLVGTGDITVGHADTSTQVSIDNINGNIIQDITLDTYGHITGLSSLDGDVRWLRGLDVLSNQSLWTHIPLVSGIDLTPYTTGSSGYPSTLGYAVAFYASTSDSTSGFGRAFALNRAYNTENYYLGSPNTSGVHNGWRLIYHSGNLSIGTLGGEPSFLKGDLITGAGISLSGTLTNRLVGDGDVTISATGQSPVRQVFVYSTTNIFSLSYPDPTAIYVSLNGQILEEGITYDWTISGTSLTISTPLEVGDEISILYYTDLPFITNYGRNIEGGTWDTVYLPIQNVDGGSF